MSKLKDAWIELKNHVVRNKERYIVGAVVVTGVVITVVIMKKSSSCLADALATSLKHHAPEQLSYLDCPETVPADVFNFAQHINVGKVRDLTVTHSPVVTVHKAVRGNPGFVTRCLETGELFSTQGAAASAFDIDAKALSMHLNRGLELTQGLHFERVGVLS